MKHIMHLFLLLLFFPLVLNAQFQDDFSDNTILLNPTWLGDIDRFAVDSTMEKRLQLKAPELADTSYISTSFKAMDNAHWRFYVRMDFNTSSTSYCKIYLISSKQNIKEPLNGYYLLLGGTDDAIILYKQLGENHLKIISGSNGMLNRSVNELIIDVTRSASGIFNVYADTSMTGNLMHIGSNTDTDIKQSAYFGIHCVYTPSRSDRFFFDDMEVLGEIPPDFVAPSVVGIQTPFDSVVSICWNEEINVSSVEFLEHFTLFPSQIHPTTAFLDEENCLLLHFNSSWSASTQYQLEIKNIDDIRGNSLQDTNITFVFPKKPALGELLINEVLFYPKEGGEDFVEIYNVSDYYINIQDCSIANVEKDQVDNYKIIENVRIVKPKEYIVLTKDSLSLMDQYPQTNTSAISTLTSFPTYPLEKGSIVLSNSQQEVLDRFDYQQDMHHALLPSFQGVSLERVSVLHPTNQVNNWQSAAENAGFATPGFDNSQFVSMSDTADDVISLSSGFISPNNDGNDDVLEIKYTLPSGSFTANISIFDIQGRLVNYLVNNEFVAVDGSYLFDGVSDSNELLPSGFYIVFADFFDVQGVIIREKKVFSILY